MRRDEAFLVRDFFTEDAPFGLIAASVGFMFEILLAPGPARFAEFAIC